MMLFTKEIPRFVGVDRMYVVAQLFEFVPCLV